MNLTPEQTANLPVDHPIFNVLDRMKKIEEKLVKNDPEISTHLKEIWKAAQEYEDLAHMLSPEQIGILMKGMQKHTAITLVAESSGKKGKSKKIGVDDLM